MAKSRVSAGLLLYRKVDDRVEVLLVHPGGPFFANKDDGAWSIPKGEVEAEEEYLQTAKREFKEEIGFEPDGRYIPLASVQQKGGKVVHVWAVKGDCDPSKVISNTFELEWPPRSGRRQEFPEIDRAAFFDLVAARQKLNPAQVGLIEELKTILSG